MASWTYISVNTSASSGTDYLIDTSAAPVYLTLPSSPSTGDQITIADGNDFSANGAVIVTGSGTIEGSNNDLTIEQKGIQFSLIYNGSTWKRYNLVLPQVKVSELSETPLSGVSNNDLMLFIDSETSESTKIKLSTIRSSIVGGYYSQSDIPSLVTDLNAHTQANTSPRLNVNLFANNTSSYYRNYNNLTNKPIIPVRTSQLINDGSIANGAPFVSDLSFFNTDQLIEGSVNWYFTNARFDSRLALKFPELFRLYSDNLEEEQFSDSVIAVAATPLTTVVASNTIFVSSSDISNFADGQRIRLFGANIENTNLTVVPTITSIVKNGLAGSSNNVISYKLAQFDRTSGKVSPASIASASVFIGDNTLDDFNITNNIEIEFSRGSGNYGILVYRSYNGSSFNLIDVLGPKELGASTVEGITYKDFANFNNNSWTRKNSFGEYDTSTGIIHMPLTAPASASKGWVDATILSVDSATNRIVLSSEYYLSSNMFVCHNDTSTIQAAINQRVAADVNSLTLNDRRYVVSSLILPDSGKFTLSGRGRQTTLYKLPWSDESHNKIVYAPGTSADNISITNLNIDGNMQNQVLKFDSGNDPDVNYTISLNGESINLDKVFVDNVIGGGLYSYQPSKLTVNLCRFENSGMSDFFAFSPLFAPEGDDVIITNNVFRNFSDSLDLNTTDNGIFSGNVVDNVGSGVLVYGSRFFISSPNILKGPAGEFIPTPDILNSEYDSVNITLEANTAYTSPAFLYQENGIAFDLTANEGAISYRIDKLGKFDNVEELYGQLPSLISDVVGPNKSEGQFQFSISKTNVETITSTYSYTNLKSANTGHVGLVYRAIQTEVVPSGTVVGSGTIDPDSLGTDKYRVTLEGYSNLAVGRIVRFSGHGGTIGANTLNNTEGVILDVVENTAPTIPQAYVTIDYSTAVDSAGNGGTLNIKNEFVLAKGRIQ